MIKKINYSTYKKQFKIIANQRDSSDLFKVDIIKNDHKLLKYYNIKNKCVVAIYQKSFNELEIKSLISIGEGYGSLMINFLIKEYAQQFIIKLDSFESNDHFYKKNGFKCYKTIKYNPIYDPKKLNKNKENVKYYIYGVWKNDKQNIYINIIFLYFCNN